jgi:CheY-like chemotaxis protein
MTLRSVLYAEDDENDVYIMRRVFKEVGIANPLAIGIDGKDAIDYLSGVGPYADRGKFPLPCLLLLDLKMPRVSGFEVLEWLRKRREFDGLAVIVLTSSVHGEDIVKAYALGANAYLVKPVGAEKLKEIVRAIKDFWLTHNTLPPEGMSQKNALPDLVKNQKLV